MPNYESWSTSLQKAGYKLTGPRRAVLQALVESLQPLSPMELHARSRTYYHRLGLVTVYRTLEVLDNLGLVRRVHREDGCHAYAPATAGHRHLVICQRCGRAEEFAGDDLSALLLKVEQATGYVVSDHWLQLFGTCPRCRVADPDLPRDHTRVRAGKDQHPRRGPGQP